MIKVTYYFEVRIILPAGEQPFDDRKLSKNELGEVTRYLQQKTGQGIPVKFRVGIFNGEGTKIMSVALNTRNTTETDIISLLMNRVTDRNILVYLNESIDPKLNTKSQPHKIKQQAIRPKLSEKQAEQVKKGKIADPKKKHAENIIKQRTRTLKRLKKIKKFLKSNKLLFFNILFIVLLMGMSTFQQVQLRSVIKENRLLAEQLQHVQKTDLSQPKIDTFGRYFLTYYFAQEKDQAVYRSNLKNFVAKQVDLSKWKTPKKNLKSVNYYGSKQTKQGYRVTYLLIVEVDNHSQMQQVKFEVKPTKHSFLVTTRPVLTDFSFN